MVQSFSNSTDTPSNSLTTWTGTASRTGPLLPQLPALLFHLLDPPEPALNYGADCFHFGASKDKALYRHYFIRKIVIRGRWGKGGEGVPQSGILRGEKAGHF